MRLRPLHTLPILACATALVLAGCGSGGGSSSASSNGSSSSSSKATAKSNSDFCQSLTKSLNDTKSLATTSLSQPSNLKALVDKGRQEASTIVAAAPSAIRDDVRTLVNASTSYYDAIAAANYDLRKVDVTKLGALTSTNVQQASQRVGAYIQSHCGINVGGGSS